MESDLRSLIARVRRRWFKLIALRVLARATVGAAIPLFAALLADRLISPQGWWLIALAAAAMTLSLATAGLALWRMQRRPDDRVVARYIEERAASLPGGEPMEDAIVSAIDVADGRADDGAVPFKPLILAAAVRRLAKIDPRSLIEPDLLRRAGIEAAIAALLLAAVLVFGAPSLRRAVETAWIAAFPDAIHVEVLPGDARVIAGQPLTIRANIRAASGRPTRLAPSLTLIAGDDRRHVAMTGGDDGYQFDIGAVDRSFTYRVAAGTAVSSEFSVSAVFPPRVARIDLRYQYPPFTGLQPRDEEDGGDIYAPAGTRVRLRIHTDKAVAAGDLALAGSSRVTLQRAGDKVLEGVLTLARDDAYRVNLSDSDGLRAAGDTEYFIRLMDDRPPDVRILRPSRDQQITPLEEVAIEARADDDYGIAKFDLVYSVSGGPEKVIPFSRITGTDVQKVGAYLLPAEELRVQPGDVITYYARARDVGRGKQSTEAKSDMFFLEVKPFGEEFVAAQSQGGGSGAGGSQIESLIAAQKEIINATWNVERRSGSGRSEADIKAIAQAQAELRARAEQMTRGGRGGGRGFFPQRIAQPPPAPQRAGDPIENAVAAMTQAQQQLESQRTREAIPHEMAALNALLQAQAEVRRRQVMQQRATAGGGGGSNRSGEDLSALFDKELQRQQRTNYETRSQVEQRPDREHANDSALDKIRDLARRQEELARQQRELAGLSQEEQKRRLEKLTREQQQLREEADNLARQMNQQGQGRGQGNGMRDASEQMRGAATDLSRQNAAGAADKGQRAAEQLRRTEDQMRSGGSGAQQATGQLQIQAQQIADAQRRIASEAERLDREGAASTADARKRLAEEKDRLASRVDDLQRAAGRAAQGGAPGADARAAAEASRELERQQIGQRMRDSAKQLRDGTPQKTAAGEQQLARALDQVVETLGGGSGEGQRLSDQLKQTRDIRDRLNRFEQQIREAEAKQGGARGAQAGREGRGRSAGTGEGSGGELQKLREEYQRELTRARETMARLQQQAGGMGATPEEHEYSRSAPGTEQFKQDRSKWESLRKDVDLALERYEVAVSDRLARKTDDRLSAGASDRVPDNYRDRVARYFQSLAAGKRK